MRAFALFEVISFLISAAAFVFGAVRLFRDGIPMYFRLYGMAAGCYALEELWAVTNTVFGTEGGYVSVRLFGTFGFFCFILSANAGEFDSLIDERKAEHRRARRAALLAPAVLVLLYGVSVALLYDSKGVFYLLLELLVLLPTFPAAYYCLKHLLLPTDPMGMLKTTGGIDIVSLLLFAVNSVYTLDVLGRVSWLMYAYDVLMALIAAALTVCSVKGAEKWKTLL